MNNDNTEFDIIRDFLSSLHEEDLYEPLEKLFIAKGYNALTTHGKHEFGKDLVGTNGEHNIIISVKKDDIDQTKWKSDVHPSLSILMQTPISHTHINEDLPRKPILIFNGFMTTYVDQQMHHFNNFYRKKGEPMIEIWDLNRLTSEFQTFLFRSALLKRTYLEDISKLIFSITTDSIDKNFIRIFVDRHLDIDNISPFKLAFVYVLRRSELKENLYAFFHFSEYVLIKVWYEIYKKNDFSLINIFDYCIS